MIKLTRAEAITATQAIQPLLQTKLPAKTAYHLARIVRVMGGSIDYYEKQRHALIMKMGAPVPVVENEPGVAPRQKLTGEYRVKPELIPDFTAAITALLEAPLTIDLRPVTLADLGEGFVVEPEVLLHCGAIIVEE